MVVTLNLIKHMNRLAPRGMRITFQRGTGKGEDKIRITVKTLGKYETVCYIDDLDFSTDQSLQRSLEALREQCAKGRDQFTTLNGEKRWITRRFIGPSA